LRFVTTAGHWIIAGLILIRTATSNPVTGKDSTGPCKNTLANGVVCEAANQHALALMKERQLKALTVMQDVRTGSLLAFAASDPATLDVTDPLLPLSTVKLMVAASWLNHEKSASSDLPNADKVVIDSIANGNDEAGRRLASALRKVIGAEQVLSDLETYGFQAAGSSPQKKDMTFWSELSPTWRSKIIPAASHHSLSATTTEREWEDTLSIGENRFTTTAFHLSRFLQAVGNHGIMLAPKALAGDGNESRSEIPSHRILDEAAASKLEHAMRETVRRGTAKNIAPILATTGWSIGGKTGTGPGPNAPGPPSDGWFVGLIFDPNGEARFSAATFVRHGGLGGGNAAWLSAELARFVIGEPKQ
jgi:hypothetical protein